MSSLSQSLFDIGLDSLPFRRQHIIIHSATPRHLLRLSCEDTCVQHANLNHKMRRGIHLLRPACLHPTAIRTMGSRGLVHDRGAAMFHRAVSGMHRLRLHGYWCSEFDTVSAWEWEVSGEGAICE
jgi:hypothetical protein